MNGSPPRPQVPRRPSASAADGDLKVRGLLHDLGHQMMTLSLLADSVRDDGALSAASRHRMEMVRQEIFRIVGLIAESMSEDVAPAPPETADLRQVAGEVAHLFGLACGTAVTVEPGDPAVIPVSASVLWRVLRNLVDNAVRAAGPGGRVAIRVEQEADTVLEVADTGPGFGRGPSGAAGIGLTVVRRLLQAAGGRLDIANDPAGGARMRVTFGPDHNAVRQPPVVAGRTEPVRHHTEVPAERPAPTAVR